MLLDVSYALKNYPELSHSARLVYGLLCALSEASERQGKHYTYIGRRAIGERIGRSESTARRAVKELEKAKLVAIDRQGLTRNDHLYVVPWEMLVKDRGNSAPTSPTSGGKVRENERSRARKSGQSHINTQRVNIKDQSILSSKLETENSGAATPRGYTVPKGHATPKRPRRTQAERQEAKKRYQNYLKQRLDNEKIIDLIADTMSKGKKIKVNGSFLTIDEYWKVVKNISARTIESIFKRLPDYKVKNTTAYFLSCVYNEALNESLQFPFGQSYSGKSEINPALNYQQRDKSAFNYDGIFVNLDIVTAN